MPTHNDMAAMLDELTFSDERPSFYLLNVGETHYPYALPDEDPSEWPRISGVHGVFKRLDDASSRRATTRREFFDQDKMRELQDRQIRAVEYLDGVFARLFDTLPVEHVGDRHLRPRRAVRRGRATSATARSCTRRSSRCRSSRAWCRERRGDPRSCGAAGDLRRALLPEPRRRPRGIRGRRDRGPLRLGTEQLGLPDGGTLLDIGCGRGELVFWGLEHGAGRAIGVEYAEAAIEVARGAAAERGLGERAELIAADARAIPLPDATADGIAMLDVIEHLTFAEQAAALTESLRLLKPGGRFVLHTFPNRAIYETYAKPRRVWPGGRTWPADPRKELERADARRRAHRA